ncbi:TPA: hypothetical protein ACGORP_002122 [Streptococcus suis]|nr:hypothetical protein [Streptococcus suis]
MSQNKFILLIVEGKSDHTFYGEMIARYSEELQLVSGGNLRIKVTHGDILTKKSHKTPEQLVSDIFDHYKRDNSLETGDFVKIVQICDVDGSYFEDDLYQINKSRAYVSDKTYDYSKEQGRIYVKGEIELQKLRSKWDLKKNRQDTLNSIANIQGIDYQIFYVSLFLEHFLTNRLIIDSEEKSDCIESYLDSKDLNEFLELLECRKLSDNYHESWDKLNRRKDPYIPCSNINILFKSFNNVLGSSITS